jgi:hypothetical protein
MLFADGTLALVMLALWIYCFIDVLLTPTEECRNLPKLAWVFLVLLIPDLGSIAWLVAGKNWSRIASSVPRTGTSARFPEYDRPGRRAATNPDDDEEFLAGLRKRAEEQRRRARETGGTAGGGSAGTPGESEGPERGTDTGA